MKSRRHGLWSWLFASVLIAGLPADAGAARSVKEIEAELQQVTTEISHYGRIDVFVNPMHRPGVQAVVLPLLQKKVPLLRELRAAEPVHADAIRFQEGVDLALCAVLGDADASQSLEQTSRGNDAAAARIATLALALRDWWTDPAPEAQQKVLARMRAQVKAHPGEDELALTLANMAAYGAGSVQLGNAAGAIVVNEMKGAQAARYRSAPARNNWPLAISQNTVQGKPFTTAQWKGKVVMVDFWATWCSPCKEELPHVVELYDKYHEQGLEIVGVSNDLRKADLVEFLNQRSDVKWPQLFGPSSSSQRWNTVSERLGVSSLPTVYLIDRNGILRTTAGRFELDELIPQLLEEKADPAVAEALAKAGSPDASGGPANDRPASEAAATKSPAPADRGEEQASRSLNLAKSYVSAQRYDAARTRLQKIIDSYPATTAAREAQRILTEIAGK